MNYLYKSETENKDTTTLHCSMVELKGSTTVCFMLIFWYLLLYIFIHGKKKLLIQVNNIKVKLNMSWKRLIQMLYKRSNKLLLGYKKINVPLFSFWEPPLKWK